MKTQTEKQLTESPETPAASGLAASPGSAVFEIVDYTEGDVFYPVGIFLTLEDAIAAIEEHEKPWTMSEDSGDCDFCHLEIRRREIGTSRSGIKVWERQWACEYGYEDDDPKWRVYQPNDKISRTPKNQ